MTQPPSHVVERRGFLTLAAGGVAGSLLSVTIGSMTPANAASLPAGTGAAAAGVQASQKRELRAMWIASVVNIDWPSKPGLSADDLKAEFLHWLDVAQEFRLNAVFVQVRPTADAFWPSPLEPWSRYLTGVQGGDPGFDPLAFMVEEAHARNLEFHAWYNPYRVSMNTDTSALVPDHPARVHPDWVWTYAGKLYFDPGLPEAREHIIRAILHSVENYDLDGVHFDDYFYPYPSGGAPFPDAQTFADHGSGFDTIEEWRRDNVNTFVRTISERIKDIKAWVKFGISPFGIWRNQSTDPLGSETGGTQSYDAQFADTRKWVLEGWLDYINPQIYWQIGLTVADYAKLAPWWAEVASQSATQLYIGEAVYKATSGAFADPAELARHVTLAKEISAGGHPVHGHVWYSANHLPQDVNGQMSRVRDEHYAHPAIIPAMDHLPRTSVRVPVVTKTESGPGGVRLEWVDSGPARTAATSFAVYRVDGHVSVVDIDNGANLLATLRSTGRLQSFVDASAVPGTRYTYVVTALDRVWNESRASRTAQA